MDKANKAVFDVNAQCSDIMNFLINKETLEELKIKLSPAQMDGEQVIVPIPKGYEFAGVDDDNHQVLLKKIKPKYPKNYKECCKVLNISESSTLYVESESKGTVTNCAYSCSLLHKLSNFRKLLICRDAYWKIAGDGMSLGKPWEPNWLNVEQEKYVLYTHKNNICSNRDMLGNKILAFPTKEMRDAFYENFKDLIYQCKELL